jgi:GAF domain-containing protein
MKRSQPKLSRTRASQARQKRIPVETFCTSQFQIPIPKDEKERLAELRSLKVLDTPPEELLDGYAQLASIICGVPIALVSLVDEDRQWFKAKVGMERSETPRAHAFCAHAIMGRKLFVVRDATRHKLFASNPLVVSAPKIRFYAGMPLVTAKGHALGTLCVMDYVPRVLSARQKQVLELLSQQVIEQLRLRQTVAELREALRIQRRKEKRSLK